jgi:hypothetical protein
LTKGKYFIVNEIDRPDDKHVAQLVNEKLYYMSRETNPEMKEFDGMETDQATPIEDFGFAVAEQGLLVYFIQDISLCHAKYSDGTNRTWQGIDQFALLQVTGIE